MQFVSNVLFSRLILGAATSRRVLAGVACIMLGVVLLVVFGSHASVRYTPRQLSSFFGGAAFDVWVVALALVGAAAYASYAATAAGLSVGAWAARACCSRQAWRSRAAQRLGRARLAVRRVGAARRTRHRRTRSESGDELDDAAAAAPREAGFPLAGPSSAAEARHIFEGYENSSVAPGGGGADSSEEEGAGAPGGGLAALADAPERGGVSVWLASSRSAPLCFALCSAAVGTFSVLFSKCTATCVRAAGRDRYNPSRDPAVYAYVAALVLTGISWDKQMNRGLALFPAATILPLMQVAWTLLCVLTGGIFFGEFAALRGAHAALFTLGIAIMLAGVGFLVPPRAQAAAEGPPGAPQGSPAAAGGALPGEHDTARLLPDGGGAAAGAVGEGAQLPPPLPPRPGGLTRGAALLRQESALAAATPRAGAAAGAATPLASVGAFDAVSFSLFAVPTLREAACDAEAEGHALPAYLRLERRLATAGDTLEDAAETLLAQAEASVAQLARLPRRGAEQPALPATARPLPPVPPPLPPKAGAAPGAPGAAASALPPPAVEVELARQQLERTGSLTRRGSDASPRELMHNISFGGGTRLSEAAAPPPADAV